MQLYGPFHFLKSTASTSLYSLSAKVSSRKKLRYQFCNCLFETQNYIKQQAFTYTRVHPLQYTTASQFENNCRLSTSIAFPTGTDKEKHFLSFHVITDLQREFFWGRTQGFAI